MESVALKGKIGLSGVKCKVLRLIAHVWLTYTQHASLCTLHEDIFIENLSLILATLIHMNYRISKKTNFRI
jgi:hypothetical protein